MSVGFIQITKIVSEVEANIPERVRQEWIGLVIPIERVISKSVIGPRRTTNYAPVYVIRKEELISVLNERNPRLAKWVRAHQLDVELYYLSSASVRFFQAERVLA